MLLVNASKYIEGSFEVWLLRRQSTSMSWMEVTVRFVWNIYLSMVYITTYVKMIINADTYQFVFVVWFWQDQQGMLR